MGGGDRRQRKGAETEELRNDEPKVALRLDDTVELERTSLDHDAHQGDTHEDFVTE